MDELISLFIDDEMTLDHKIVFVETVHEDGEFKELTLDLLRQEQSLRAEPVAPAPAAVAPRRRTWRFFPAFPRMAPLIGGALTAALLLLFLWRPDAPSAVTTRRFVIYRPDVQSVAVAGTFTDWHAIPMKRIGDSGYWERTIQILPGEHRFSYILDGGEQMPDPTVLTREKDDFGGVNSIIRVEVSV